MRRNIRDDFEMVYLRYNDVKKFINKADPSVISDPNFSKCIDYITSKYFVNNKSFFSKSGFEYEDLRSIAVTFGLTFMGREMHYNKDPRNFSLMIRYVDQRIFRLYKWIVKKFNMEDVVVTFAEDIVNSSRKRDSNIDLNDHKIMQAHKVQYGEQEEVNDSDAINFYKEDIDELKLKLEQLKTKIKRSSNKDTVSRLKKQHRNMRKALIKLSKQRGELKKKMDAKNKINKEWFKHVGEKFYDNPQKYTNILCYYATTKHVSFDVRKKARLLCKKYDISYKNWLQERIKNQNIESAEFSF